MTDETKDLFVMVLVPFVFFPLFCILIAVCA